MTVKNCSSSDWLEPRESRLALGTVQWGQRYGIANRTGQPQAEVVADLLRCARQAGISILDTARAYGSSEETIGALTAGDSNWRVVTKLDPAALTASSAAASLDASCRALGRNVLDCVLLHRADQRKADGGSVWDFLRTSRDHGCIRVLGLSAGCPEEAWEALDDPDVQCIQVASSLFDQRLTRGGFFDRAAAAGKAVFVRSVFLQGAAHLSVDKMPAHLFPLREALVTIEDWAQRRQVTRGQVFLAFAARLRFPRVLLGCETVVQLAQNLEDWHVAETLVDAVDSLAAALPGLPEDVLNPAMWPTRGA